jgi:3-mercaptopyruvate sulfurtransferase SseA
LISPQTLAEWLAEGGTVVLDFTASANYVKRHIPGAWWALRAQLPRPWPTCRRPAQCADLWQQPAGAPGGGGSRGHHRQARVLLQDGTTGWIDARLPLEDGETHLASPRIDRYRRPYEGTDNPSEAMQAYLDWEFGLVEQLARDGTHGFMVI